MEKYSTYIIDFEKDRSSTTNWYDGICFDHIDKVDLHLEDCIDFEKYTWPETSFWTLTDTEVIKSK